MTTILSQTAFQLKTAEALFPGDYGQGALLLQWTERGRISLALDPTELRAFLRVLHTDLLVAILGERGVLCTMGGEAPDVAEGLDALASEHDIEVEGTQFHFSQPPPVFHDGSLFSLHAAEQTTAIHGNVRHEKCAFLCQCPACRTAQEQAAAQKEA